MTSAEMTNGKYTTLKTQLEELGYSNHLPLDAVPLVECLTADLLQTTQSLQHYMDLAKKAIQQRDSLMLEAEPYKCENGKLIRENNDIRKENIRLKEELHKLERDTNRNTAFYNREIEKIEMQLKKYQLRCRQLELKGICADTYSFRCKSRKTSTSPPKKMGEPTMKVLEFQDKIEELKGRIEEIEQENISLKDELEFLSSKLDNREKEIVRLEALLEGGRPHDAIKKDCCYKDVDKKIIEMAEEVNSLAAEKKILEKKLTLSLEKQHEAMTKAVELADKNNQLQDEIKKVDMMAMKVEEECNSRLQMKADQIKELQERVNELRNKNIELEVKLRDRINQEETGNIKQLAKENDELKVEIKILKALNRKLEDKILKFIHDIDTAKEKGTKEEPLATKQDLKYLLDKERRQYENYIENMEHKIHCTVENMNKSLAYNKDHLQKTCENEFIKNLHRKINACEEKILELKTENQSLRKDCGDGQVLNDLQTKIKHLNLENSELLKENLSLSDILGSLKKNKEINFDKNVENIKYKNKMLLEENNKLNEKLNHLMEEKDDMSHKNIKVIAENENLRAELNNKQKQYEQVYEENCSYRMSNRSGKASADFLKDECRLLRDKVKLLKDELAKERAISCHAKSITLETERNTNEMHTQLLELQKQMNLNKNKYCEVDKRCKELQIEISVLKSEKFKLMENLKTFDAERDQLIMELDNKTEYVSVLEQKIQTKNYELERKESELYELRSKLTSQSLLDHKHRECETKIAMLENDFRLLRKEKENALAENKRFQNELAEASARNEMVEMDLAKSRKEVNGLRAQLQHYVAEVKRIEDLLSQKEKQREEMLEHFASLSVEANLLESNNHSLENEATAKSMQVRNYLDKIKDAEHKLEQKIEIINKQSSTIAAMTCKITNLTEEINLLKEEKASLEDNVSNLKELVHTYDNRNKNLSTSIERNDSELQTWEERFIKLKQSKEKLEMEVESLRNTNESIEQLLKNARKEVIELKLALQDATSETRLLKEQINSLSSSMKFKETELDKDHFSLSEIAAGSQTQDDFEKMVLSKRIKKKISTFTADSL